MTTWPQWTVLTVHVLAFAAGQYSDGKKGNASGAFITLLVNVGMLTTLYYGGFWSVWGIAP